MGEPTLRIKPGKYKIGNAIVEVALGVLTVDGTPQLFNDLGHPLATTLGSASQPSSVTPGPPTAKVPTAPKNRWRGGDDSA